MRKPDTKEKRCNRNEVCSMAHTEEPLQVISEGLEAGQVLSADVWAKASLLFPYVVLTRGFKKFSNQRKVFPKLCNSDSV